MRQKYLSTNLEVKGRGLIFGRIQYTQQAVPLIFELVIVLLEL